MMNQARASRLLYYSVLAFAFLIWIFPTCRLWLFGSKTSESAAEVIIGILPEMALMFAVFCSALYIRSVRANDLLKNKPNVVFLIFLGSNLILGVLLSMYPKLILYGFRTTYIAMFFFVVGYAVAKMPREQGLKLLDSIIRVSVFFAFVGLILYFFFPDAVENAIEETGHEAYEYYIPRMTSILWTPVLFGFLMAISCVYYYLRIMYHRKTIDYVFFTIAWISLFLSVSRGSILAFMVAYLIIGFYYRSWPVLYTLGIMVGTVYAVNWFYFGGGVSLGWMMESTSGTVSLEDGISRVERWRLSFEAFKQRPMGYGMGHGGATAYRFLIDSDIKGAPYSTDGWYIKMLCENGVYGLLSSLIMAGWFFVRLVGDFMKGKLFIHAFALLCLIMVAVHSVPSNTLDYQLYICVFWLVIGMAINTSPKSDNG